MNMTSRGVGDVRRVLGQSEPQSWVAQNFPSPGPQLPNVRGDKLFSFVASQVAGWESQVALEAREYQSGDHAAAILRWAQDIHRHCASVRRVLVRYAEATVSESPELPSLRATLEDLARSFSRHPDWHENWDSAGPRESCR
jgi:hypothetical protein